MPSLSVSANMYESAKEKLALGLIILRLALWGSMYECLGATATVHRATGSMHVFLCIGPCIDLCNSFCHRFSRRQTKMRPLEPHLTPFLLFFISFFCTANMQKNHNEIFPFHLFFSFISFFSFFYSFFSSQKGRIFFLA